MRSDSDDFKIDYENKRDTKRKNVLLGMRHKIENGETLRREEEKYFSRTNALKDSSTAKREMHKNIERPEILKTGTGQNIKEKKSRSRGSCN